MPTPALKLYQKHSQEELLGLARGIEQNPANRMPSGTGIYLYTPPARRKLDAIAQAITFHLADKRAAQGDPVPTNGYSGRQSNRRR